MKLWLLNCWSDLGLLLSGIHSLSVFFVVSIPWKWAIGYCFKKIFCKVNICQMLCCFKWIKVVFWKIFFLIRFGDENRIRFSNVCSNLEFFLSPFNLCIIPCKSFNWIIVHSHLINHNMAVSKVLLGARLKKKLEKYFKTPL